MNYKTTRFDIQPGGKSKNLDLDFILNIDDRKIIHGTVWDDSDTPKRIPDAIVSIYIAGKNYNNDPNNLSSIGYVITDYLGEFFIGPFDPDVTIVLKVFKCIWDQDDCYDNDGDYPHTTVCP